MSYERWAINMNNVAINTNNVAINYNKNDSRQVTVTVRII